MRKIIFFLAIFVFFAISLPNTSVLAEDNGVDDFRGRWDVEWVLENLDSGEVYPQLPLILYVNDSVEFPYLPGQVFAAGCMRSPETNAIMPLSLVAKIDPENNYEVSIYSTVVPDGGDPYVVRLKGTIEVNGKGVPDDEAYGEVTTEWSGGEWTGVHHDRRRTKCPSRGYGDFVQADVRLQQDRATDPPSSASNALVLELYTPVVSAAMQVELPDGSIRIIEHYTDIFSPDVDFVGRFRFFEHFEGEQPVVGQAYKFVLLDLLGNVIPGTESTDTFWRCTLDAPKNYVADGIYGGDIELSWEAVPIVAEEFDPELQGPDSDFHPPYQINIGAYQEEGGGEYGALTFSESHIIPWDSFDPGESGQPDGFNFGQPLSSFAPGMYQIVLDSWNMADVEQGGHIQDCVVYDSSETLFMEISDGELSFIESGTISGLVSQSEDGPLEGVWVDACVFDQEENPLCQSALTNENGEYRITTLLPGNYRVRAGGGHGGWVEEFYNETPFHHEATPVTVSAGEDTGGIDFTLEPGGSISGNVSDGSSPLAGVHVDACDWEDNFCMGAETDEDGNYTIFSLPVGDYRVVVWGDQGGWIDEFYVETPFHHEATPVTVTVGQDTGDIDFTMEPGGSISGNVSDGSSPLAGMHVEACDWNNAFCMGAETQENGNYTIFGLPAGDYRVRAGGQSGWIEEYYLETAFYDSALKVPVTAGYEIGDINFTLELGGSISGHVSDAGGSLAGVHVDACDWNDAFCLGAETEENGNYTIFGLSAGDYRVSVWGGQGGWIDEFYEDTPFYDDATKILVTAGADTGGIDFSMDLPGSISGSVFDSNGNPLGGIGVDTEMGGYGTCTNEDGSYSLDNLPLGTTVNVVAGRDFCGPHSYEEQTQFDVDVGSSGVDFYLTEGYYPTLHVVPAHPEVHGHGWHSDALVTIYVDDDDDLGNGTLYSETKLVTTEPTWCGEPCFDLNDVSELPDGILPNFVVTMTDGDATRIVHVTNLVWTGADTDRDTVYGTADANTWVEVSVHGPELGQLWVQAEENGYWEADFSMLGTEDFEQDIVDLGQGYHGRSIQFEGGVPDDGTLAYWGTPDLTVIAHPDHEWVSSHGWTIGDEITLHIHDDPLDGTLLTLTQTAVGNPDNPDIGQVEFTGWEPFDLMPGMVVIVTDGASVETLHVEALAIDYFDEPSGIVSGAAPPEREVGVGVHEPGGDFWMIVTSGVDGTWEANFGEGVLLDVFDIHCMIWDDDGDATQANFDF